MSPVLQPGHDKGCTGQLWRVEVGTHHLGELCRVEGQNRRNDKTGTR